MRGILSLNVLDLYLDSENPRHNPIDNQQDIIAYLLKNEKVKNLAKDIATNGISPIELFAVIKDDTGKYVAVEGNRRLCALRLLNSPQSAPNADQISYFKNLAESHGNIENKVKCAIFNTRKEADIWIERRHEGEQDGVGTRRWDADQISRHKRSKNKVDNNALALSLLDYASSRGFLDEESKLGLLTTASRYLGNPYFRKTLGIVSPRTESEVVIDVSYSDFNEVLERFVHDLTDKNSGVNSRTKSGDWEKYAQKLVKDGVAPNKNTEKQKLSDWQSGIGNRKATLLGDSPAAIYSGTTAKSTNLGVGSTRNPDKRPYLVSSSFKAPIKNKTLRRVFEELKTLQVDHHPLAVSLLTRAFLENVYAEYIEKVMGENSNMSTHIVLDKIIKNIEAQSNLTKQEKSALTAIKKVQSNTENILNPRSLGANAHGKHYPNAKELKREWDNIDEIVQYMVITVSQK